MFTKHEMAQLQEHVADYPEKRAGAIYCLYAVQDKVGFINDEGIGIVSELTGLSKTQLEELISFFTLLRRRPVGRHVLRICDSISCYLMGSHHVLSAAEQHSGVPLGEIGLDGAITVLPSICLGLCDQAPAALLNDREAIGLLTEKHVTTLLDQLKNEDVSGSALQLIATSRQAFQEKKKDG